MLPQSRPNCFLQHLCLLELLLFLSLDEQKVSCVSWLALERPLWSPLKLCFCWVIVFVSEKNDLKKSCELVCKMSQHRPLPKWAAIQFKFLSLQLLVLHAKGLNQQHDSLSFSYRSLHSDRCTSYLWRLCFSGLWHLITGFVSPDFRQTVTSRAANSVSQLHSQNICGTYWRLSGLPGSSEIDRENTCFITRN